jgi:hypothetical protein
MLSSIINDLNLSDFGEVELKVFLAIARQLKGRKDVVSCSLSELQVLTGSSRTGICNAVRKNVEEKRFFVGYEIFEKVPRKLYSLTPFKNNNLPNGILSIENSKKEKEIHFPGYVYLIQADLPGKPYKIGKSVNVPDRLKTFEIKLPFDFKLIHTIKCKNYHYAESVLHKHYARHRVDGEWFQLSDDNVKEIKSIKIFK